MTTLVVRYLGRRGSAARFWTVDSESLTVQFRERHRRTGRTVLGMPEVEPLGPDRSTVSLRAHTDEARNARGLRSGIGWLSFRLLDRNKHIRYLIDSDLDILAAQDAVIAEKEEELKVLRSARRTFIEQAWDRGQKVEISLLEEKANA